MYKLYNVGKLQDQKEAQRATCARTAQSGSDVCPFILCYIISNVGYLLDQELAGSNQFAAPDLQPILIVLGKEADYKTLKKVSLLA